MSAVIFLRIDAKSKEHQILECVEKIHQDQTATCVFYVSSSSSFILVPNAVFAYWLRDEVRKKFQTLPCFEQVGATAKAGLCTGDDFRFVRLKWEVNETDSSSPDFRWNSFAKGGAFGRYYSDIHLMVNWWNYGEEIVVGATTGTVPGARPQNTGFFFRPGLTWPLRTTSEFGVRVMPAGCISGHKGPAAYMVPFDNNKSLILLSICNSAAFRGLLSIQLAAVSAAARSYEVGVIQRTVVPKNLDPRLGELALAAWTAKRQQDTANPVSHAFLRPALAQSGSTLAKGIESWSSLLGESAAIFDAVQSEIDDIAYRLYGLGEEDRRAIEKTLGGPEGGSKDSTDASGEDEEANDSPSTGANTTDLVTNLLDYVFGCSFGRWDIRYATGEKAIPEPPAPFDPLPACPTAQLQNALGLPASPEDVDAGYPIEIPWDGILVDDENHPHDVIKRVREILGIVWEDRAEAIEQEACEILEVRSLRDWFRNSNNFFAAHLRRHSKSRRQAPIYWPLSSPNGLYTVWLYYHRLTADTLFTVLRDYLKPKLEFTEHRAFQLRQEAGTTLSPSQRRNIAEAEELVGDLNALKADLERVAPLFRPNLNDGVVINYAPLWRMIGLPKWRRDCQTIWNKLAKGDYDWAHLALYLWPERVIPKCATDRSLAIAHGLEAVFWQEDPEKPGKWIARKVTDLELRGLMAERTSAAVKAAVESLVGATSNEGAPRRGRKGAKA